MLVQASGLGNLRDIGEGHFEAHLLIPGWAFNEVDTGQSATTNTRKGIVSGKVIHKYSMKDNGVFQVDLSLEGHLPEGLRRICPWVVPYSSGGLKMCYLCASLHSLHQAAK